jgi:hypothetical protein
MDTQHTPGPWEIMDSWHDFTVKASNGEEIIFQDGPYGTPTIKFANARLIAAAPDLMKTLSKTLKTIEEALACGYLPAGTEQELEAQAAEIRAAIAKVKGETA